MNILVTGAAGYIGSAITEELINHGHKVVALDSLQAGHHQAVVPEATFIQADLADRGVLDKILASYPIEAAIHLAAHSLVAESMAHPTKYFQNNVVNSLNLLEAMLGHGVKKLVFSSTAAIYGEPASVPILEGDPEQPTNVYGESKLILEKMLRWYSQAHGLRYISLRYFNAAGASFRFGEDHNPETHLIPNILKVALGQQKNVPVFGLDYDTPDGSCIRDYIHVVDLAQAHLLSLVALDQGRGGIYNLGNGNGYSVLEVIAAAREVTGTPIPTTPQPRRPGDPPRLVANSKRAQAELGWQPCYTDLREIVSSAWEWHRTHPHGYGQAIKI